MTYNFSEIEDLTISYGIVCATDIILGITMILGFGANVVTMCTIIKTKHLQSPMNISLVSLAVTDLFACVLVIPLRLCLNNASLGETSLKSVCKTLVFMKSICDYAQPCMLVATSYERFQSVAKPFESKNKQRRIIIIVVSTAIVCTGLASVSVILLHDGALIYPCHTVGEERHTLLFREGFVTLPFGLCCIGFVLVFYILMIRTLREHSKSMFKKSKTFKERLPFRNKRNKIKPSSNKSIKEIVTAATGISEVKTGEKERHAATEKSATQEHISEPSTKILKNENTSSDNNQTSTNVNPKITCLSSMDNEDRSASGESRQEKHNGSSSPPPEDGKRRKLSVYLAREYIFKSAKRRLTIADDFKNLISKKSSRKDAKVSQGSVLLISDKDDAFTTVENNKQSTTTLVLSENMTSNCNPTADTQQSSPGNKFSDAGQNNDTHYKDGGSSSSSELLPFTDLHSNDLSSSISKNVNSVNCSANMEQRLYLERNEDTRDKKERYVQCTNQNHDAKTSDGRQTREKACEISDISLNATSKESKFEQDASSYPSKQNDNQGQIAQKPDSNTVSSKITKGNGHLLVLKRVTENTHVKIPSSNSFADTTMSVVKLEKDKSPESEVPINNGISTSSKTADEHPNTSKTLNNVDIVDFDGTVHKDVLVEGPVCGAVCVMNPTNKVAGRRKVEMRAAKRIAILIGSFTFIWLLLPTNAVVISSKEYIVRKDVESLLITASISSTTVIVNPVLNLLLNKQLRSAAVTLLKRVSGHFKQKI